MFVKKISLICSVFAMMAVLPHCDTFAATKKASKQSAIQTGTKVRTKVEVSGLYDQECYDAYYGCMDSFCISDNESGGSCTCSDLNAQYEKELLEIKGLLDEAERIRTVEVEKVQAGANADIIFGDGEREYDEDGNTTDIIKDLFEHYCREYFSDMKIGYFDDFSLDEVLKKSRVRNEWDEKLAAYKLAEETFLGLKVFETN